MGKKANRKLTFYVHSMTHRGRHYDFIKRKILKELERQRERRNQLAKDDKNINTRWRRKVIMEKSFDKIISVGEDGEFKEDGFTTKAVQIIDPPSYITNKAKQFPPPRTTKVFMRKWYMLISDLVASPMFKRSHLAQLELLCEMYEDLEICMNFLRQQEGFTYHAVTERTSQIKAYPEVAIVAKLRTEIRNMFKQLGLGSGKEVAIPDSGDDDWS